MAHSDCGWTCGCAGKTVKSLDNTCYHTWALLRWWFTTKRRYNAPLPLCTFCFRDRFQSKITNLPTPCAFNAAAEGVPLGIVYRHLGSKTGMMCREKSLTISSAIWIHERDRRTDGWTPADSKDRASA